ncbi:MAG: hypothetical protein JKY17_09245 [Magnetovibrio sp.]|nr:hypothetical protein [Magnetovibrio sp.]
MTVTIDLITPGQHGFTILGATNEALQDVHIYFQTSDLGHQSANLRATSNQNGQWIAAIPGDFPVGTKITAFARYGRAKLASLSQVL